MIISDEHRFVFVHIPKCAGTSVREQIARIDSYSGKFGLKGPHPKLGYIDYSHLPLKTLRDHFPEEFEKVCSYRSVALIREPRERFVSAIFQHLREFHGIAATSLSRKDAIRKAADIIKILDTGDVRQRLEFVHFNRQFDYLCVDGKIIVRDLFCMDDMMSFVDFVRARVNISLDVARKSNASTVSRFSAVSRVKKALRPAYMKMLSSGGRDIIKNAMLSSGLYVSPNEFYDSVKNYPEVSDFVDHYYANDLDIYHAVVGEKSHSN